VLLPLTNVSVQAAERMQSELSLKSQWGCSGLGRKGEESRSADIALTQSPLEHPPEIARAPTLKRSLRLPSQGVDVTYSKPGLTPGAATGSWG